MIITSNSVYLYDDRMTIIFNAGDEPVVVDGILLDEIEEDAEDAKSLYSARFGSPKRADTHPGICFFCSVEIRRIKCNRVSFLRRSWLPP